MTRIYHSSEIELEQNLVLGKKSSHHLIRVLRSKKGSKVTLFNGDGYEYLAEILDDNSKNCQLEIKDKTEINNESPLNITLLQGISRGDRMDSCIQKSVELGIHTIIPVICQKTGPSLKDNRAEKKLKHWQQIIISACEQSGRCIIPEIKTATNFLSAVQNTHSDHKIILAPNAKNTIKSIPAPNNDLCILIGPEGGFTEEEIQLAMDNNFISVSLGPRILRTETAGPACVAIAQTLWGDLNLEPNN